jgi:hypothetical protein
MFDVFGIDPGKVDALCGFPDEEGPKWVTEEEAARREAVHPSTKELVEELIQDPDVRAVVEAFTMKPVALETTD